MAFNIHFDLPETINNMPLAIRREALFAVVGSINATLINAADSVVRNMIRDGYDFKDISVAEFDKLLAGPDGDNALLEENRALSTLGDTLRGMLRMATETPGVETAQEIDRAGSIYGTLKMMTGTQRKRMVNVGAADMLKALDIELSEEQIELAVKQQHSLDQAMADARSTRRGEIEFVLDKVFHNANATEDDDCWNDLSAQRKEMLTAKMFSALNAAQNKAVQNVLFGRSGDGLGAGDIPILRDMIVTLNKECYPSLRRVESTETQPA
jgi:hypothetical protein